MITESQRKEMVAYLRNLGNGCDPDDFLDGICGNFKDRFDFALESLFKNYYDTVKKYKKFSGNIEYPVNSNFACPREAFAVCELWSGDYGKERREFARYLADQLENEG